MSDRDLLARIHRRAVRCGVTVSRDLADGLAAYLSLLARWNLKINLTGLTVDPPDDEAVDRLLMEPVAAAKFLKPDDRVVIDIGSGGGSPAIPLWLTQSSMRLVMIESKVRKSAFLREVVRQLDMADVEVENRRFEELLSRPSMHSCADLITLRAVRVERGVFRAAHAFAKPGGRLWLFRAATSSRSDVEPIPELRLLSVEPLAMLGSVIEIYECL